MVALRARRRLINGVPQPRHNVSSRRALSSALLADIFYGFVASVCVSTRDFSRIPSAVSPESTASLLLHQILFPLCAYFKISLGLRISSIG